MHAATLLTVILIGAACGGGSDAAEPDALGATGIAAGVIPSQALMDWNACARVPAAGDTSVRRSVREFGAVPDDDRDDADALQRGLDALQPGETLWFTPGRYLVGRGLRVRRPGITLAGGGAVLHATNPDDMALMIEADDTTVASLTFTAVTNTRRSAARHSRIAINAALPGGEFRTVRNTVIRDNRILGSGAPGTPQANSASAGGILVSRADRFLIAGNTVLRTLADGIHITNGSRNGRVLNNRVSETGDDMIAVVSYADSGKPARNSADRLLQLWDRNVERGLDRNILIAGNEVSNQYWGRGISVVGGRSIAIVRNTLENIPVAAGILLAREAGYQTFGVDDVLVEGNVLRDVQTLSPSYDGAAKFSPAKRTGHAAIEVHAALFDDEAADSSLRSNLAVRNVLVRGNRIERSKVNAVRAGVPMNQTVRDTDSAGQTVTRVAGNGLIERLSIQGNRFDNVSAEPINVPAADLAAAGLHCNGNQRDGRDYSSPVCKAAAPAVRGMTLSCSADGRLL